MGLILLQPDLGTAMVLVPVAAVGAYLAGMQWKHVAVIALAAAMLLPVAWHVAQALPEGTRHRLHASGR